MSSRSRKRKREERMGPNKLRKIDSKEDISGSRYRFRTKMKANRAGESIYTKFVRRKIGLEELTVNELTEEFMKEYPPEKLRRLGKSVKKSSISNAIRKAADDLSKMGEIRRLPVRHTAYCRIRTESDEEEDPGQRRSGGSKEKEGEVEEFIDSVRVILTEVLDGLTVREIRTEYIERKLNDRKLLSNKVLDFKLRKAAEYLVVKGEVISYKPELNSEKYREGKPKVYELAISGTSGPNSQISNSKNVKPTMKNAKPNMKPPVPHPIAPPVPQEKMLQATQMIPPPRIPSTSSFGLDIPHPNLVMPPPPIQKTNSLTSQNSERNVHLPPQPKLFHPLPPLAPPQPKRNQTESKEIQNRKNSSEVIAPPPRIPDTIRNVESNEPKKLESNKKKKKKKKKKKLKKMKKRRKKKKKNYQDYCRSNSSNDSNIDTENSCDSDIDKLEELERQQDKFDEMYDALYGTSTDLDQSSDAGESMGVRTSKKKRKKSRKKISSQSIQSQSLSHESSEENSYSEGLDDSDQGKSVSFRSMFGKKRRRRLEDDQISVSISQDEGSAYFSDSEIDSDSTPLQSLQSSSKYKNYNSIRIDSLDEEEEDVLDADDEAEAMGIGKFKDDLRVQLAKNLATFEDKFIDLVLENYGVQRKKISNQGIVDEVLNIENGIASVIYKHKKNVEDEKFPANFISVVCWNICMLFEKSTVIIKNESGGVSKGQQSGYRQIVNEVMRRFRNVDELVDGWWDAYSRIYMLGQIDEFSVKGVRMNKLGLLQQMWNYLVYKPQENVKYTFLCSVMRGIIGVVLGGKMK